MVQTFVIEETESLIYDSDALKEWKDKCEALGLTEQLALAAPEKSPIPFECLNTTQLRVYETLCPAKEDYRKYRRTPIPLEVLSLIAMSEKERYFDGIEIWYDEKSPDPFAIGYKKETEWTRRHYCIARWGDELRPFDELKQKAIKLFRKSAHLSLLKKISDAKALIENIDVNTERYFDSESQHYEVVGF